MTAFKLECTIKRPTGTHAPMPPTQMHPHGKTYWFKPTDKDDPYSQHVADVADPQHLAMFLRVTQSFRFAEAPESVPARGTEGAAGGGPLVDPLPVPFPTPEPALDGFPEDDDELRALFERTVGRKPSHKAMRETMIAQIRAATQAGETA
jgi:hypothetical protein